MYLCIELRDPFGGRIAYSEVLVGEYDRALLNLPDNYEGRMIVDGDSPAPYYIRVTRRA